MTFEDFQRAPLMSDEDRLEADLLNMGCPYGPRDSRAAVWIEGAKAGANIAYADLRKAIAERDAK